MRISDWSSDVCSSDLGGRALLRLHEYAAQIFAQHAHEERVHGDRHQDQQRRGRKTGGPLLAKDQPSRQIDEHQDEGEAADEQAHRRCDPERDQRMVEHAVDRQPQHRLEGELALAGHPCPAIIFEADLRSEEHTSELQSLMRISYAVFCLTKNSENTTNAYTRVISTGIYRKSTPQNTS